MSCWTEELPELPGVYKLTNLVNGKIYIGESKNLFGRMKKYPQENSTRTLIFAIKKYGWNNFKKEAIEIFPFGVSKKILRTRETFWIKFFNSFKNGYNEIEDTYDVRGVGIQAKRKRAKLNGLVDSSKPLKKQINKADRPNFRRDYKNMAIYSGSRRRL